MRCFERVVAAGAVGHLRRAVGSLPAGRLLDVGTGTGRQLTPRPPSELSNVVGVDPVEGLVTRMRRRLPGVSAVVGDAHHLPFRPAGFDAAVGGWVWETLADRAAAARELHAALRPGGVLLLVACTRPSGPGRLVAGLLDVASAGLFGTTVDEAELTDVAGFALVDRRRFSGGLFTVVRLQREPPTVTGAGTS